MTQAQTAPDVTSPDYRRCADPRAYYDGLRAKGDIDTEEGFEGRVQVLRLKDGEQILRDAETFSSGMEASQHGNARPLIPLQIDPPDHVRYRRLLDPVFAPRSVARLEPDVAALTNQLIDRFYNRGSCDFSQDLAQPLPPGIFLRLLGLPFEGLDDFIDLKNRIIRPPGQTMEERLAEKERAGTDVYALFEGVIEERRKEPRDDIVTLLVESEVEGERLSHEELLDICYLLLLAGLDTVTISLQCMFHHLATNAEHRRMLAGDVSLAPAVVEELLRWETPVQGVTRVATRDVEVTGQSFPAHSRFQVMLGAVNTDPQTAEGYDTIDFTRSNNRHLAFGGGVHRCLGSHLARLELRTVLREWHTRIPEYEIDPGAEILWNGAMLRGIEHLPFVWQPPS
jgi:cytochrome P450